MFLITVNALFIAITALFTYLSIKKLKDYKSALTTLLFFILNPIFYLYVSYCYTDTLCMPFAAIAIYLYILSRESKKIKYNILLLMLSGVFIAIGYEIRAVIIILLIAILMELFINNKFSKKMILSLFSIIIGFLITLIALNQIIKTYEPPKNQDTKFPTIHWVMMGLNKKANGGWTTSDYSYTHSYDTAEEKKQADLKMINKRLSDLGPNGYISLVKTKLSRTWSNGNYYSWSHLSVFNKTNSLYEYINGTRRIFLAYYEQICKIIIMLMLLISIIVQIRNNDKNNRYRFIHIAIFGAFLFYILWEALVRYSLTFLPWLMLIFDCGITGVEKILNLNTIDIKLNNNTKNINMKKIFKSFAIGTIAVTTLLLAINYYTYTVKKSIYYDNVIVQNKMTGRKINKIGNKRVKQYFKTNKNFDKILITMLKDNDVNKDIVYKFVLYNSEGIELYKDEFTSDDFKNYGTMEFKFPNIKPNGKETYSFEIYSEQANLKETIGIASYYYKGHNMYKDGKLSIDGKTIKDCNMEFWVKNKTKRAYTNKKVYLTICILVILVEIIAFYPYLKRKK